MDSDCHLYYLFRAPVEASLYQISSGYDESYAKVEADWKVIIPKDSIHPDLWRPHQVFQVSRIFKKKSTDSLYIILLYGMLELLHYSIQRKILEYSILKVTITYDKIKYIFL